MSILDTSIIAIFLIVMIQGAVRGFIAELIAVIGVVAAFMAASRASGGMADKLVDSTGVNTNFADPIAFIIVFFAVILIFAIIGSIIPNPLKGSKKLAVVDHLFGGIISFIRPMIYIGVASLIAFTYIEEPTNVFGEKSTMRPVVLGLGSALGEIIPANAPFSKKGGAAQAPVIDPTSDSGGLPGVKDKMMLEQLIEKRIK